MIIKKKAYYKQLLILNKQLIECYIFELKERIRKRTKAIKISLAFAIDFLKAKCATMKRYCTPFRNTKERFRKLEQALLATQIELVGDLERIADKLSEVEEGEAWYENDYDTHLCEP